MRIVVHDYAGHPFQPQLSRELARRGHEVVHAYSAKERGRQGALSRAASDPPGLSFISIKLEGRAAKRHTVLQRMWHERAYSRAVARVLKTHRPDLVISANTPLYVQRSLVNHSHAVGAKFIYWMEDWISLSQTRKVNRRLGRLAGVPGGRLLRWLEKTSLAKSDAVIVATPGFLDAPNGYGLPPARNTVIPNWAPVDEITPRPRDNAWAAEQGLSDHLVFMYAGALGLKQNPSLLVDLAHALPDATIVVVAEGAGADFVRSESSRRGLRNVRLFPTQPYDRLADVLASADVMLAIIDAAGARYSVPSKVLTYLCTERPILGCLPSENLSAQMLAESGGGLLVAPGDVGAWVDAGRRLAADQELRRELARNGRAYAERTFDIAHITDKFEAVIGRTMGSRGAPS